MKVHRQTEVVRSRHGVHLLLHSCTAELHYAIVTRISDVEAVAGVDYDFVGIGNGGRRGGEEGHLCAVESEFVDTVTIYVADVDEAERVDRAGSEIRQRRGSGVG